MIKFIGLTSALLCVMISGDRGVALAATPTDFEDMMKALQDAMKKQQEEAESKEE